jgi:hypothetical protein
MDVNTAFAIGAVVTNGMVAGASLDQSIKQLPARRRIGTKAYSAYAKAADLTNGVAWYGSLGVATLVISLGAAVIGWNAGGPRWPLALLAAGTIGHTLVTAFAAPTYHSQKRVRDEAALEQIFTRFERLQTVRVVVQVATLAAAVWALTTEVAM